MWDDLQEAFYLTFGPLILYLILPLFGGVGLFIAIAMAVSWLWRPLERVVLANKNSDEDV